MAVCTLYDDRFAVIKSSIILLTMQNLSYVLFKFIFIVLKQQLHLGRQFINKTLKPYKNKDMKGHISATVVSCADFLSLMATRTKPRNSNKVVTEVTFIGFCCFGCFRHTPPCRFACTKCKSQLAAASFKIVRTPNIEMTKNTETLFCPQYYLRIDSEVFTGQALDKQARGDIKGNILGNNHRHPTRSSWVNFHVNFHA